MPVHCVFTNRRKRDKKGQITVKKVTLGGEGEFKFTLTGSNTSKAFTLAGGAETSFKLKRGTYAIEERDLPEDWDLEQIDCGQGKRDGKRIMVKLDPKESIVCIFTNRREEPEDPDDPDEPKRFVKRRLDNLISHEPDRARMLRRLQEHRQASIKDTPLKLSGAATATTARARSTVGVRPIAIRRGAAIGADTISTIEAAARRNRRSP